MLNWEHETDMDGNWWHTIVEHSDVTLEVVIHEMNENAWHPYQWEVWDISFDGMPEVSGSESTLEQAMEEAELAATNSVRWQPLENFAKKRSSRRKRADAPLYFEDCLGDDIHEGDVLYEVWPAASYLDKTIVDESSACRAVQYSLVDDDSDWMNWDDLNLKCVRIPDGAEYDFNMYDTGYGYVRADGVEEVRPRDITGTPIRPGDHLCQYSWFDDWPFYHDGEEVTDEDIEYIEMHDYVVVTNITLGGGVIGYFNDGHDKVEYTESDLQDAYIVR